MGHVLINSQFQVIMEKASTVFPCHASRVDKQTARSREFLSAKGNVNGEGTDKVLRLERNQSVN
jgi:hypothetical protein